MNNTIEDRIKNVIALALETEIQEISDKTNIDNTYSWDSLNHIRIILGLEQEFNIMIPPGDIVEMKHYNKIVEIISKLK